MAQRLVRTTRFQAPTTAPAEGVPLDQRQVCLATEISSVQEFAYLQNGTLVRYTDILLKGTSSSQHIQCKETFEDVFAQWQGIGAVRQDAATEE